MKIISDIEYETDIKREIIFFDFSDKTETSYEKLLFQDVEKSLNTHNFLMHLSESGIAKYQIIDLSTEFIPAEIGWYGITQNRIAELRSNPPRGQTPAYLMTILDYQKLQELGKTLGFVDSPEKKLSYSHLNKRALS